MWLFLYYKTDVFLIGPAWTTYRPQCLVARHQPIIISTSFQADWKLTPDLLDEVHILYVHCSFSWIGNVVYVQVLSKPAHQNTNKLLIFCNPDNPSMCGGLPLYI